MTNAISIYKGGSSVILPNGNDVDIFCYYKTNDERIKALTKNADHSKDYHFVLKDKAKNIFFGCYAYPYMELVSGEDLGLKDFNVKDHEIEYAKYLIKYIETFKDKGLTHKRWYHIYLGYCAIKNDSGKKFTKTQIEKAQKIHDNGISLKDLNNIFDYLTNLVNN